MIATFTDITEAVNFAFLFILAISVVLLVFITFAMIFFVIKYHRKRNPVASQISGNAILEIVWTVIPTFLALGMFYYGWIGYRLMKTPPPGAMEVTAVGRMWSWQFKYANGKQSSELYVPVSQPVKVNIESTDVLHSFYVPAYMVKQDAVPGLDTFVWFEPKETGSFDIFCAEYCGNRHSYMLSKVIVVPEREFEEWVAKDVQKVEAAPEGESDTERTERLARLGRMLSDSKGCTACHSSDGSKLVGPTYKGLFGKTETVVTSGKKRQVTVDEAYLRKSILEPNADVVDTFQPLMPSQQGLVTDDEISALIEYIKTVQ